VGKIADKKKLKTLLKYWIDHNREHSEEFQEWSEKANAIGESEVAEAIQQSIAEMDKAAELLSKALKKLGGKEG
jgi:rubrerythrin